MTALSVLVGLVGVAACIDDLWRRQISNWISGSACAAGFVLQTVQHGVRGTGSALLGALSGAAVFLVFYLLGGMGGGDVKLMAGFGALLGVKQLLRAALWTAGCGGLMAVAVLAARAIWNLSTLQRRRSRNPMNPDLGSEPASGRKADAIPYAPAIAAGVWLSLVAAT
ncbi:MAG TPA: prepilin peptidase [Bryobacteraceae bacterium]|nr:prepilin peptidase [Bryobacteraceae bacterium]